MKINSVIILLLFLGNVSIFSQEKTYILADQHVADKVIEEIVDEQSGATPENIGWAKGLLQDAFKAYFSNRSVKAKVYEQSDINALDKQIKALTDSVKRKNSDISKLTKQLSKENIQKQLDDLRNQYIQGLSNRDKAYADTLSRRDADIVQLRREIAEFQNAINDKDALISKLEANSKIAENVIAQHDAKKNVLEALYMGTKGSQTLEYIEVAQINNTVKDYVDYLQLMGLSVPHDLQSKIDYLKIISNAGDFYQRTIAFMDKKYDTVENQKLLDECQKLSSGFSVLNNGQQTVLTQIEKALSDQASAINHFRKSILPYISEQGQIPDEETTNDVKQMVLLRIQNYAEGRYTDTSHYDPYFTNLNRVVDKTISGLKKMDEDTYKKYLQEIIDSL